MDLQSKFWTAFTLSAYLDLTTNLIHTRRLPASCHRFVFTLVSHARRMPEDPLLTRQTLLIRLRDSADDASWAEFAEIYTPLMVAYCRKRELRHADTSDIVQNVMRSVSLALKNFQYDPEKGKFKGWLFTSLRNAISSHFRKQAKTPITTSDTNLTIMMDAQAEAPEIERWEKDYRQRLLAWSMEKVRPEFGERTWRAFEETAVNGREFEDVASELDMTVNALTVARHRIIKRVRTKAQSVDPEHWEGDILAEGEKA